MIKIAYIVDVEKVQEKNIMHHYHIWYKHSYVFPYNLFLYLDDEQAYYRYRSYFKYIDDKYDWNPKSLHILFNYHSWINLCEIELINRWWSLIENINIENQRFSKDCIFIDIDRDININEIETTLINLNKVYNLDYHEIIYLKKVFIIDIEKLFKKSFSFNDIIYMYTIYDIINIKYTFKYKNQYKKEYNNILIIMALCLDRFL